MTECVEQVWKCDSETKLSDEVAATDGVVRTDDEVKQNDDGEEKSIDVKRGGDKVTVGAVAKHDDEVNGSASLPWDAEVKAF